ncbi:MGMT family protein [Candidatus Woesearchaeota archaeon]|nr:MGMT family protein [Candidatus Woesearchaeota archaeon]MBW3016683.1 MGMT family protein [Candidatus Woesearchaeota archaeon]
MSFADRVYKLCKRIPKGRVSTYKEIGNALGGKGQIYRAVGVALNKNPFAPVVPCHRVVNSDGRIGGFALGVKKKVKLLESEGVKVVNGKIKEFRKVFFRL